LPKLFLPEARKHPKPSAVVADRIALIAAVFSVGCALTTSTSLKSFSGGSVQRLAQRRTGEFNACILKLRFSSQIKECVGLNYTTPFW
jgi:hypothetical protein